MRYYAGIGSRETPVEVCDKLVKIAQWLAALGYTLRSGHADGADLAFEAGAAGKAEIFLPWAGFNAHTRVQGAAFVVGDRRELDAWVDEYHPAPERLSRGGRACMRRNTCQVLGRDLSTPVDFVVCWARTNGSRGGTGQALRIAEASGIPVFNLFEAGAEERFVEHVRREAA